MRSNFLLVLPFLSGLIAQSASAQVQSIMPHIADGLFPGGSFRTTFIIVNNTDSETSAVLRLTGDNGDALALTIAGHGTGSIFNLTLGSGATQILQTTGSGDLVTGTATIASGAAVGASAVFSMFDMQGNFRAEAGVGDAPVLSQFTLPVDNIGTFDTGIALYNPSASAVSVSLRLLDTEGTAVGTAPLTLLPGNHTARFVSEIFSSSSCNSRPDCASDLQGSVAVSASGGIAALVLRQTMVAGTPTYTSLPITPGVSQGKVPLVLLSKRETGVAVTSNVTLNAVLPAGMMLTGTVSPTAYANEAQVCAQSVENVFSGFVDQQTGKYLIILPPGLYNLTVRYSVNPEGPGNTAARVSVTADGGSVQVSGNTVKDISLQGVNLFSVSGTVTGLDTLPTASPGGSNVGLVSADNRIAAFFPLNETTGAWQGALPSGTYRVSIQVGSASQDISAYSIGFLTVDGTAATGNVTVPPVAKVSGILTLAGGPGEDMTTQVSAYDSGGWTSTAVPDAAGNYRLTLANHRTYTIGVTSYGPSVSLFGSFADIHVTADTSLNVTVPAQPATVTLSGTVTDPGGRPVPNTTVVASSSSIPGLPDITFSQRGETDAAGHYSIDVPSGTYDVMFYPRPIELSAAGADRP